MKNDIYDILRNDIQWLLKHYQVCMVNCQYITNALLEPIVTLNVHKQV